MHLQYQDGKERVEESASGSAALGGLWVVSRSRERVVYACRAGLNLATQAQSIDCNALLSSCRRLFSVSDWPVDLSPSQNTVHRGSPRSRPFFLPAAVLFSTSSLVLVFLEVDPNWEMRTDSFPFFPLAPLHVFLLVPCFFSSLIQNPHTQKRVDNPLQLAFHSLPPSPFSQSDGWRNVPGIPVHLRSIIQPRTPQKIPTFFAK